MLLENKEKNVLKTTIAIYKAHALTVLKNTINHIKEDIVHSGEIFKLFGRTTTGFLFRIRG